VRNKKYLALALAGAFSISAAVATTLNSMDMSKLAKAAEVAVVGEVVSARTVKTDDGIFTISKLKVDASIWGSAKDATLEVSTPGGSLTSGRYRVAQVAADQPLFTAGKAVILLLARDSTSGMYNIVGFNQGAFQVVDGSVMLPGHSSKLSVSAAMSEINAARLAPANEKRLQQ
jgi:hypothetical protein